MAFYLQLSQGLHRMSQSVWKTILNHFGLLDSMIIERQRLTIFLLSELGMVLIGIASTILYNDLRNTFFYINNPLFILLPILLYVFYDKGIFSLTRALFWHLMLIQAAGSSKIIYAALTATNAELADGIIILDMTLMLSCFLIAYLSNIRYINIVIVVASLITYIAAIVITDSFVLMTMLPAFCIMFLLYSFFANVMNRMIAHIALENVEVRSEQRDLSLRYEENKRHLNALISLTNGEPLSKEQIQIVISMVGRHAEKNLRDKVRYLVEQERIDYDTLATRLPELAPSEIAICDLILKGKKLKEICTMLDKTESNISSQRSHIRAKLGLTLQESLQEVLESRMGVNSRSK
ncbi:MAG: hypothetical protein RRY33_07820 [Alistipes sp.]